MRSRPALGRRRNVRGNNPVDGGPGNVCQPGDHALAATGLKGGADTDIVVSSSQPTGFLIDAGGKLRNFATRVMH